MGSALRLVARTFAKMTVVPYVAIAVLLLTGSPTWSGVAYLLGLGLLLAGLVTLPASVEAEPRSKRPRGLCRVAACALVTVAAVRSCTGADGPGFRLIDGGGDGPTSARLAARLVDEGDVAIAATRVLVAGGMLSDDSAELPAAMRASYERMRAERGDVPSPLVPTYLGLERPSSFDLVLIEPPSAHPRGALVFLHGFAGNFDLPCWQLAGAVADLDVLTACPSTTWVGEWSTESGEATLRRTLEVLRARGVSRVILAGLSNGGYGASLLAPRMRGAFAGVILLSGADAAAPAAGAPTLVIHGTRDSMAGYEDAQAYASRAGARLVGVDAGHFVMLVRAEVVDELVHDFVAEVLSPRASR